METQKLTSDLARGLRDAEVAETVAIAPTIREMANVAFILAEL